MDFSNSTPTKYINRENCVRLRPRGCYDLAKTLECGQCFRWEKVEGSRYGSEYIGVACGKVISVAQDGEDILLFNTTEEELDGLWDHYFAFSEDYERINAEILKNCKNPTLAHAVETGRGIRIMHQAPWETTCSFIISQNNNIPRIKKIIESLCAALGEKIPIPDFMAEHGARGREFYTFPTPERIAAAGEEYIFSLKTGFRAKYIVDAAEKWCDGTIDISEIKNTEKLDDAIEKLCTVKGIGLKVASCTLLFGFERYDPFPVDVWMKRVLDKYFEKDFDPQRDLGRYAGVAQQYLFDYERSVGSNE